MADKGIFSYYYNNSQQKAILFICMNILTFIVNLQYLMQYIYNVKQTTKKIYRLSKVANILIFYSNIIYFYQINRPYQSLYITVLLIVTTAINYMFFLNYQIHCLSSLHQDGNFRNCVQLILVLFLGPLSFQLYQAIIIVFLIEETIFLTQLKRSSSYRKLIYPHIVVALLYLPLFTLIVKQKDTFVFYTIFNPKTHLYIGIYLFILYQLNFKGLPLFVRKCQFKILTFLKSKISILNVRDVCRICYYPYSQESQLIKGNCQHKFHRFCWQNSAIKKCPIDQENLKIPSQ